MKTLQWLPSPHRAYHIGMQNTCGLVLFPDVTQLDLTGPYDILCRVPGLKVVMLGVNRDPVRTEHGLAFTPDCSFSKAPALDILLVPGGKGVNDALGDPRYIDFLRRAEAGAAWITSVCTGALLLGAAGLLRGYRATTHWRSLEFLPAFGAIPVADQRVVEDRNRITSAGVSAGIDFAFLLASKIAGEQVAQEIQLMLEYNPAPPFHSGHPTTAPAEVRQAVEQRIAGPMERRREAVRLASNALRLFQTSVAAPAVSPVSVAPAAQ